MTFNNFSLQPENKTNKAITFKRLQDKQTISLTHKKLLCPIKT